MDEDMVALFFRVLVALMVLLPFDTRAQEVSNDQPFVGEWAGQTRCEGGKLRMESAPDRVIGLPGHSTERNPCDSHEYGRLSLKIKEESGRYNLLGIGTVTKLSSNKNEMKFSAVAISQSNVHTNECKTEYYFRLENIAQIAGRWQRNCAGLFADSRSEESAWGSLRLARSNATPKNIEQPPIMPDVTPDSQQPSGYFQGTTSVPDCSTRCSAALTNCYQSCRVGTYGEDSSARLSNCSNNCDADKRACERNCR